MLHQFHTHKENNATEATRRPKALSTLGTPPLGTPPLGTPPLGKPPLGTPPLTPRVRRPVARLSATFDPLKFAMSPRGSDHSFGLDDDSRTIQSSECDEMPLNYVTNFRRNDSAEFFTFMDETDIKAWMVPLDFTDQTQSLPAFLTKFRPDYLKCIDLVRIKFGVNICVRLQENATKPATRRYSLLNPNNQSMFASGKKPPTKSKTNTGHVLLAGHIARRDQLQEKKANPLDNNVPGAWPDDIRDNPIDVMLTTELRTNISVNITAAKMWQTLICWEENLPSYGIIDNELKVIEGKSKKYFIQEALPLHRLIRRIENSSEYSTKGDRYEFVAANTRYLVFRYNDELFKIKLDLLIPQVLFLNRDFIQFKDIAAFKKYVNNCEIATHHSPLFHIRNKGGSEPEMVWCDRNGPITGDADLQLVGKRFDMPRIAYAVFWGENLSDHAKFMHGLILFEERIKCRTAQEFRDFVNNCELPGLNITDYISRKEFEDDANYINYMDTTNTDRYEYYIGIFLPALRRTINKYTESMELFYIVCHSDLYSLVINVEINHELAIHAPEDTNHHAGPVGAVLCLDADNSTYATENNISLIIAILSNPRILSEQVIGINPAYLLDGDEQVCKLWLDTLKIRCLNAALISNFEFDMHWATIIRVFSYDQIHGPNACKIVNEKLATIKATIRHAECMAELNGIVFSQTEQDFDEVEYIREQRIERIRNELQNIYEDSKDLCEVLLDKLTYSPMTDHSDLKAGAWSLDAEEEEYDLDEEETNKKAPKSAPQLICQ